MILASRNNTPAKTLTVTHYSDFSPTDLQLSKIVEDAGFLKYIMSPQVGEP